MKCIFCKEPSDDSRSVEHIIPESLGNYESILSKGAVCDKCNNYFATKVEKIVLDSDEFVRLRFNQSVQNKKGRIPPTQILINGVAVSAHRTGHLEFTFNKDDFQLLEEKLNSKKEGRMYIPVSGSPPPDHFTARFLAKMAVEALALRWSNSEGWNDYHVNHKGLDVIRNFARYPKKEQSWIFSKRRIYDENAYENDEGTGYQVMNEWDFLATGGPEDSEVYFVIAIFGVEYAINLGGNSIDGYKLWLQKHNQASPLYHGKNA